MTLISNIFRACWTSDLWKYVPSGATNASAIWQVGRKVWEHLSDQLRKPEVIDNVIKVWHIYTRFEINNSKMQTLRSVVVSDPKWIKEMFSQDTAFAGRQIFEGTEMYEFEQLGIISSEGELWQVHRRFLLRHLRDFGFGKSSMEDMILGEVHETIERMRQFKGGPVNQIKDVFQIAIVNSLWMIVGSKRYQHDNPEVLEILHGTDKFVEDMMNHAIVLFVPWTRYFLPRMKLMDALRAKGQVFYKAIVDEHKATLVPDAPRDFIDVYLNEMEEQKQTPSSTFYGEQGGAHGRLCLWTHFVKYIISN